MKRIAFGLTAWLLAAPAAHAFDSQCREGDVRDRDIFSSVCASTNEWPECSYGFKAARGTLWGEHNVITKRAMEAAGLEAFTARQLVLYYRDRQWVSMDEISIAPTGPGAMKLGTSRSFTLPELSQVPDWSYSLADYLLGNEHCPAATVAGLTPKQIADCHSFRTHMGSVNSTHFLPQARAMYELYHTIALRIAERCKKTKDEFNAATPAHPLKIKVSNTVVPACEKEALAFESVASHYLADAWSTGHMFERWGSPVFPIERQDKLNQQAVGIHSGSLHGWRILSRDILESAALTPLLPASTAEWLVNAQHDQLSMPGLHPSPSAQSDPIFPDSGVVEMVGFRMPSGPVYAGGGDTYAFSCVGSGQPGAISTSPFLSFQWRRMLSCLARGFKEVYDAGPKTLDNVALTSDVDSSVTSSLADDCWSQRLTNLSMVLGAGFSAWPASRSPVIQTALVLIGLEQSTETLVSALGNQEVIRQEIARTYFEMLRRARANPNGTDVAELTDSLSYFLGSKRNSEALASIRNEEIEYLERKDPAQWQGRPQARTCSADSECPSRQYCGESVDSTRKCFAYEAGILNFYRDAEMGRWCSEDTKEALERAARDCKTSVQREMRNDTAECFACKQVVIPHVRNACDLGSYAAAPIKALNDGDPQLVDHGSLCDTFINRGVVAGELSPLHLPYDPTGFGTADDAALAWCRAGRTVDVASRSYNFDAAPPAVARNLAGQPLDELRNTCGAGLATHWWRLRHESVNERRRYRFTLTPRPISVGDTSTVAQPSDLTLGLYACGTPDGGAGVQAVGSTTQGGSLVMVWEVNAGLTVERCLRVKVADNKWSVWSAYQLTSSIEAIGNCEPACEGGTSPTGTLCCRRAGCAHLPDCPTSCVVPKSDMDNCGACGVRCPSGLGCCGGTCPTVPTVLSETEPRTRQVVCCPHKPDETCVLEVKQWVSGGVGLLAVKEDFCTVDGVLTRADLASDPNNCRNCGQVCQPGESCCFGFCVNRQGDINNCGSCGTVCPGPSPMCCNGACMRLGETATHCQGCNLPCAEGYYCLGQPGGGCIANGLTYNPPDCATQAGPGFVLCGGACVRVQNDVDHCGACGRRCPPEMYCCGGACVPGNNYDEAQCGGCGRACAAGEDCCGGMCFPRSAPDGTSVQNCGGCNIYCKNNELCCNGRCINGEYDDQNCTFCGSACASGLRCCGGACADTAIDEAHCGGCHHACASGQHCCAGRCYDPLSVPPGCG